MVYIGYKNNFFDVGNFNKHFLFKKSHNSNFSSLLKKYFRVENIENLSNLSSKFFYPISEESLKSLEIDSTVLSLIKHKKCILLFNYSFEVLSNKQILLLNKFTKKFNIDQESVVILNNNLKLDKVENYKLITIPYFLLNLFTYSNLSIEDCSVDVDNANTELTSILKKLPLKKFIFLNRGLRPHRIAIFAEISKNEELRKSTYLSFGAYDSSYHTSPLDAYTSLVENSFKYEKQTGIDFINSHDFSTYVDLDLSLNLTPTNKINYNLFQIASSPPKKFYNESLISIVTETSFENDRIFITEKLVKAVQNFHPFIIVGNPDYLTSIKQYGFKTFEDFWDEEYDTEINFSKRLEKILDILNYINSKDIKDLLDMRIKMKHILLHNYLTLHQLPKQLFNYFYNSLYQFSLE